MLSEEQSQLYQLLGFLEWFARFDLSGEAQKKLEARLAEVRKALEVKRG